MTRIAVWTGLGLVLGTLAAVPVPALAQGRAPTAEPGTHVDGLAGIATTDVHTGPLLAGIVGWGVAGGAAVEVRASWLARGRGAHAFHADVGGIVNVLDRERVRPFLGGGFGLYRAAFDSTAALMSGFYRSRLGQGGIGNQSHAFVDPAFRLTAGADWRVHDRVSIRPEVSGVFVRRGGRGESIALIGVRVSYRFEDRPVTP